MLYTSLKWMILSILTAEHVAAPATLGGAAGAASAAKDLLARCDAGDFRSFLAASLSQPCSPAEAFPTCAPPHSASDCVPLSAATAETRTARGECKSGQQVRTGFVDSVDSLTRVCHYGGMSPTMLAGKMRRQQRKHACLRHNGCSPHVAAPTCSCEGAASASADTAAHGPAWTAGLVPGVTSRRASCVPCQSPLAWAPPGSLKGCNSDVYDTYACAVTGTCSTANDSVGPRTCSRALKPCSIHLACMWPRGHVLDGA